MGLALAAGPAALGAELPAAPAGPGDAAYWRAVASQYDLPDGVTQLENGNWGSMARPVLQAYDRHLDKVNRLNSYYSRRDLGTDVGALRRRIAGELDVQPTEIAFTRGATEALLTLINGYNRLRPGDAVLYADLDYDSMQAGMESLKRRRGVEVVTIALPQPATRQGLIDTYEAALSANPRVRLMLLTHVSHRTGLVLPVAEITALARRHGVDVILDAAHSWGQLDFRLSDLGADFVGLTCQKWIGAPMGTGLLHIRGDRLADIDAAPGSEDAATADARSRIHTGTLNFAAFLGIGDALDFHQRIGAAAKEARLRALRDRWAEALRGYGDIEILTPDDPRLTCGITSFRRRGKTGTEDNKALARDLLERYRIFTVERTGMASGACVRVTPGVFTSEDDIDRLVAALKEI